MKELTTIMYHDRIAVLALLAPEGKYVSETRRGQN